jgi:hypothetical protein
MRHNHEKMSDQHHEQIFHHYHLDQEIVLLHLLDRVVFLQHNIHHYLVHALYFVLHRQVQIVLHHLYLDLFLLSLMVHFVVLVVPIYEINKENKTMNCLNEEKTYF